MEALAIAACFEGKLCEKAVSPCGACRQVMSEMIRRYKQDFDVIMVGGKRLWWLKRQIFCRFHLRYDRRELVLIH